VKDPTAVSSTKRKQPQEPRRPPTSTEAKPPKKPKVGGSEEHAIEIGDEKAGSSSEQPPVEGEAKGFVAQRRSTRNRPATSSSFAVEQGDSQLFQYPFGALERDSISITRADLGRLQEPEFLNDSLVDFHLKLQTTDFKESKLLGGTTLLGKSSTSAVDLETLKKDVHIFSSHFYTKFHEGRIDKRSQKTKVRSLDPCSFSCSLIRTRRTTESNDGLAASTSSPENTSSSPSSRTSTGASSVNYYCCYYCCYCHYISLLLRRPSSATPRSSRPGRSPPKEGSLTTTTTTRRRRRGSVPASSSWTRSKCTARRKSPRTSGQQQANKNPL
jgi:hypothetical protein